MIPTAVRLSKAFRGALTPKRGNKDFYKGTRQAFLPGGHRTGAPGKHVVRGNAKYRLLDEKVRVYVAPPIEEIDSSPLRPYVALGTTLSEDERNAVFGKFRGAGGLTPRHYLRVAREHTYALENPQFPARNEFKLPTWMSAQMRLGLMTNPYVQGVAAPGSGKKKSSRSAKGSRKSKTRTSQNYKELEIVPSSDKPS